MSDKNRLFRTARRLDCRGTGGPDIPKGTLGVVQMSRRDGRALVELYGFDWRHLLRSDLEFVPSPGKAIPKAAMKRAVGKCPHCGRSRSLWLNDVPLKAFCWGSKRRPHGEWSRVVPRPFNPYLPA